MSSDESFTTSPAAECEDDVFINEKTRWASDESFIVVTLDEDTDTSSIGSSTSSFDEKRQPVKFIRQRMFFQPPTSMEWIVLALSAIVVLTLIIAGVSVLCRTPESSYKVEEITH